MAVYGSAFNMLFANTAKPDVKVGDGATMLMWSDRHAATVVAVRYFKTGTRKGQVKEVDVQRDKVKRTDANGMSESQTYDYQPDPDAPVRTYRADAKGRLRELFPEGNGLRMGTAGLLVGSRREYHDFSF
ncbi:MAG: hypothetical protein ACOH10_07825 [Rhodoglobus sp.]